MNTIVQWFAIYTRRNCEKKVCSLLEKKGIAYYCPQNKTHTAGPLLEKFSTEPLFPGTIFVQTANAAECLSISQFPNVINLLYWKQQVAFFPATEIELMRNFVEVHEIVQVTKTGLHNNNVATSKEPATIYTIKLPSLGYTLSAVTEPATNIKLVRKNTGRFNPADGLAFMLGLKVGSNRLEH